MLSILKTVLTICVFFVHLSSSSVIKRGAWHEKHNYPWWPYFWPQAPPPHHSSHSVAGPTTTSQTSSALFSSLTTTFTLAPSSSTGAGSPPTLSYPSSSSPPSSSDDASPTIAPTSSSIVISTGTSTLASSPVSSPTALSTITVIPEPTSTQTTTSVPLSATEPAISSSSIHIQSTTSSIAQPASTPSGSYWKPTTGTTWQIELSGTVTDTTYPADVFDVDLFDTPASTITALQNAGKKVICYFSAGSYENWRPDQASFQASDKGSALVGWAGEWWLNTNSANVRTIMTERIQLASSKGCNGVDPDNVDGYDNANGLNLSQDDAINYLQFLANATHSLGLSIGLKNAGEIVTSVLPIMEWHVNEQCVEYQECDLFRPFIDAGKPVFHIEYPSDAPSVSPADKAASCDDSSASGFSSVLKDLNLDAWIDPC